MKIEINELYLSQLKNELQLEINCAVNELVLSINDKETEIALKKKLRYLKQAFDETYSLLKLSDNIKEVTDENYIK